MATYYSFIAVWCLLMALACSGENRQPKIAIVGGGIGGTATAYFLSTAFKKECSIDLYEHDHIGGRLKTVDIGGRLHEVGGTVIHRDNLYMSRFVETLGLEKHSSEDCCTFAISNGKETLFKSSCYQYLDKLNAFWRYGFSPLTVSRTVADMLNHFSRIYDCLDAGDAFATVEELLVAMDQSVYESTKQSTQDKYRDLRVSETFIQEVMQASIRVNYGQNVSVHSLIGLTSMAGSSDALWTVKGGVQQVPRKLLEVSNARHIKDQVLKIQKLASDQFKVYTDGTARIYDVVIIAAPFIQQSFNIDITGTDYPEDINTKFHRTVATMVQGTARMVEEEGVDMKFIVDSSSNINSVTLNAPVDDKETTNDLVYKVFSQDILTEKEMEAIFTNWSSVSTFDWLAYPHYSSSASLGSFVLSERLFYVNAIERAASAMEMLAIAAKNVASLAYYDWTKTNIPQHCSRKRHVDEL